MSLTLKQKERLKRELSEEYADNLLADIKADIRGELWDLYLNRDHISELERMWEYFYYVDYTVEDEEEVFFWFDKEICKVWDVIRKHILPADDDADLTFDKKAIWEEIMEKVNNYLKKLED